MVTRAKEHTMPRETASERTERLATYYKEYEEAMAATLEVRGEKGDSRVCNTCGEWAYDTRYASRCIPGDHTLTQYRCLYGHKWSITSFTGVDTYRYDLTDAGIYQYDHATRAREHAS